MAQEPLLTTVHTATLQGDADTAFRWLSDVSRWPNLFGPTIHAARTAGSDKSETIRLWALANGEVRSWESRRDFDPSRRQIRFDQVSPQDPLRSMGGSWTVNDSVAGGCAVVLIHEYSLLEDRSSFADFVHKAVKSNSVAELTALAYMVEHEHDGTSSTGVSFSDTVELDVPAEVVYEFIDRADLWSERLDHVAEVTLEVTKDIQKLAMVTVSPDGDSHPTSSIRVSFPEELRMTYKQTAFPPAFRSHTGSWQITALDDKRCEAVATHTVYLDLPQAHIDFPGHSLAELKALVRRSLGTNSRRTLASASEHYRAGSIV